MFKYLVGHDWSIKPDAHVSTIKLFKLLMVFVSFTQLRIVTYHFYYFPTTRGLEKENSCQNFHIEDRLEYQSQRSTGNLNFFLKLVKSWKMSVSI